MLVQYLKWLSHFKKNDATIKIQVWRLCIILSENNDGIYKGSEIYVIGRKNLHNELIFKYLNQQFNIPCILKPEIECVQSDENVDYIKKKFILFDTLGKDLNRLFFELNGDVKQIFPYIFLALFNMDYETGFEIEALRYGIKGFFYIGDSLNLFLKGVHSMLNGELWVSRELMKECITEDMKPVPISDLYENPKTIRILSNRETEILGMVAIGSKNKEIANKLYISPHTVKTHLYNIYKKIHVGDRLQAVLWAAKNLKS